MNVLRASTTAMLQACYSTFLIVGSWWVQNVFFSACCIFDVPA